MGVVLVVLAIHVSTRCGLGVVTTRISSIIGPLDARRVHGFSMKLLSYLIQ